MTNYHCKNFKKGHMTCELCIVNRRYIDLQNANCESCFEPDLNHIKPV